MRPGLSAGKGPSAVSRRLPTARNFNEARPLGREGTFQRRDVDRPYDATSMRPGLSAGKGLSNPPPGARVAHASMRPGLSAGRGLLGNAQDRRVRDASMRPGLSAGKGPSRTLPTGNGNDASMRPGLSAGKGPAVVCGTGRRSRASMRPGLSAGKGLLFSTCFQIGVCTGFNEARPLGREGTPLAGRAPDENEQSFNEARPLGREGTNSPTTTSKSSGKASMRPGLSAGKGLDLIDGWQV